MPEDSLATIYQAQAKQILFHKAKADEVLYGGAAGGGKTEAILWDAIVFCLSKKDIKAAIFRRTFPELEKSLILRFLQNVPRGWYKYNQQQRRVSFYKTNSILEFNHCQYEKDVFAYQSAEYDRIYFDELTHFSEFIYTYLRSRLRTTRKDVHPQIKSASNPGGIGHVWVQHLFIADAIPNKVMKRKLEQGLVSTQFIPARVFDNKYIIENDPKYVERLLALPESQRKSLLDGDWNVFEGQFFKEWRDDIHVVKPFKIPSSWIRFRAFDWGYRNPSCMVWMAIDQDKKIYVYRELYVTKKTDIEITSMVKKLSKGEKIRYTIADPSLWSVTQYEKGESLALRFAKLGVPLIKGDNNRLSGASTFHSYLKVNEKDNKPSLMFFNTCKACIRTIPALIHDDKRPEDVNTDGDDHAYDAVRYGLMAHPLSSKPKKKKPSKYSFFGYLNRMKKKNDRNLYIGGI